MRLGVAVRLGLALFVLVAASLAIVYAAVVPSLDKRLVDEKIARTHRQVGTIANLYRGGLWSATELANTFPSYRVAVLTPFGERLNVYEDSAVGGSSEDIADDPVAKRAFSAGRIRGRDGHARHARTSPRRPSRSTTSAPTRGWCSSRRRSRASWTTSSSSVGGS